MIVALVDILLGTAFEYMVVYAKGGDTKRYNYICNEVKEDILIFGASRAIHHYNPVIITDSIHMSCYNCGQVGNGIVLNYGRYQLVCQRYHPKVLIYDLFPSFDLLVSDDNHKYLGHLRPYYDKKGIPEIFESVDNLEKYKMKSWMYRFNSKFIQIISDYVKPLQNEGTMGFRPIYEEMDTMKISRKKLEKQKLTYDTLKISFIKKMIETSKETRVVFVVSPFWDGMDTTSLQPIKTICHNYGIPFIDFSNNNKYIHHNEYFKDSNHLNFRGADEFTRDLIIELRKRNVVN